ncbi:adrenoceptor alpha 1Bb isoform X2 [Electrophorus electricus]|uniref:adrenoceptor alpha 1Bb isoform X2 n=1 Tax=Electrophorus electricus TaxID=8005 RepID=UPI0015D0794A|nr:adrenoceptor alpha 1Bb isoform X2 [Electrophorus electricus]
MGQDNETARPWANGYSWGDGETGGNANASGFNHTEPHELRLSRAVPLGLVLGTFIVFAVVGNILVILSVVCNKRLRSPTNYFIVNLALADLLLSTTVLPVSATLEVLDYWLFGRIFCDVWAALDVLCCTASIMSLCVISIDRYIGVSHPLVYPCIVTERKALLALLAVWVISVTISIGPLFGWKQPQSPDSTVCVITQEPFYALFSSLGSFYIPLVVILIMYCRVYIVAKQTTRNLEAGVKKERLTTVSFNVDLRPPDTLFKVIFWLGYFNSCLNPVIYPCYSREFKLAFMRILHCRWGQQPRGVYSYHSPYSLQSRKDSKDSVDNYGGYLNGSQRTLSTASPCPSPAYHTKCPPPLSEHGGPHAWCCHTSAVPEGITEHPLEAVREDPVQGLSYLTQSSSDACP